MEIEKSREIGFCFGVRRAIDMLEQAALKHGRIETLGAVVHNHSVTEELERKGVSVVHSLNNVKEGIVAVSSHGVGPEIMKEMGERGLKVIDATCPRVRRAQHAARDLSKAGFYVVVFGDADHPEVRGVLGWAKGMGTACADISALPDAMKLSDRIGILSQTTLARESFAGFSAAVVNARMPELKELRIVNTLCPATMSRQAAAAQLARKHSLVLVVGGKASSNTRKLVETCRAVGTEAYLVETASEVRPEWLKGRKSVGLAAGASTPDSDIEAVTARIKELAGGQ